MGKRGYLIYDVFTGERLAGNPLAVVPDAEGLDTVAMQKLAREFNLSESVFVLPPENPRHRARIRIFTPDYEMPFAGHPTVGSAIALAERAGETDAVFVLEENIGPVRCAVSRTDAATFAEFDLARLPEPLELSADPAAIGAALGLGPHEVGFENHRVSFWSAGVPYVCVPVANLDVAGRVRLDARLWDEIVLQNEAVIGFPYVYCRETVNHDCSFHTRMFAPQDGIPEDPATGSAAAAFAGAILTHDEPVDGIHRYWLEQGIEMGRPSRIRLEVEVAAGGIEAARIGGNAVKLAEGTLFV